MLELLFVLYICRATECQVEMIVPEEKLCTQYIDQMIEQRGPAPDGITLKCQKYTKAKS